MSKLDNGSGIQLHAKVNIDPLGSHCSLCGKPTNAKLWFPLDWAGKVDRTNADPANPSSEAIWGWWPVGNDCAKKFEAGIVIERN